MNESMERVSELFRVAPFIRHLNIIPTDAGVGWCEGHMEVRAEHLQQHGYVHAGVVTTLADHNTGAASFTAVPQGFDVITIEYKMNFLRPAIGPILYCRGDVLRAGKTIVVAESCVFSDFPDRGRVLVAKCVSTLSVIPLTRGR